MEKESSLQSELAKPQPGQKVHLVTRPAVSLSHTTSADAGKTSVYENPEHVVHQKPLQLWPASVVREKPQLPTLAPVMASRKRRA